MTIPAALAADLAAFQSNVSAAAPLRYAPPLQIAALVAQGAALLSRVDAAIAGAGAALMAPEPSGHPTKMISDLRGVAQASLDQSALSDLRGYLGRAVFNLAQVPT